MMTGKEIVSYITDYANYINEAFMKVFLFISECRFPGIASTPPEELQVGPSYRPGFISTAEAF